MDRRERVSAFEYYVGTPSNELRPDQANVNKVLNRTTKVGSYIPNRLGLYDMHGNVAEWSDTARVMSDGTERRLYKRGAWSNDENTAANWGDLPPTWTKGVGFRLARVPVGK